MKLRAKQVRYSSIVGGGLMLMDEGGAVAFMVNFMGTIQGITKEQHQALDEQIEAMRMPVSDLCMICGKPEPKEGWHTSGCHDGDMEFFCSAKCFNDSCDYADDDYDDRDSGEDCGRWVNGRLSLQCSKAGSEECDWECPIGLPARVGERQEGS